MRSLPRLEDEQLRGAMSAIFSWMTPKHAYPENYGAVSWLFLRLIGLIYLSAFASMTFQIKGLIGSEGILPIASKLTLIESALGNQGFWIFPTVFWFDASDESLLAVCLAGILASLMVVFNFLTRIALVVCFALYLSIVYAGQIFMSFQWDYFLLESGFLAIFLTYGSRIVIYLYRWLVFRFVFMGGVVKLASGDPNWANLSALFYHYETQPLPTPLAWYAHHLPDWIHQACAGGVFFIELIVPFLMFAPRRPRLFAAWCTIALQTAIIVTGNYNFFNLLTLALCLFLFEDRDLPKLIAEKFQADSASVKSAPGKIASIVAGSLACLIFLTCGIYAWTSNTGKRAKQPFATLATIAQRFALVNNYGPFAIMTTRRLEIIVEGSNDGIHWLPYGFRYKPDSLNDDLAWIIPHQPRLDWQMWFAVLKPPDRASWVVRFLARLKQGSSDVLALMAHNPFADGPPSHVRSSLYRYTYTSPAARSTGGRIWQHEFLGTYWLIEDGG